MANEKVNIYITCMDKRYWPFLDGKMRADTKNGARSLFFRNAGADVQALYRGVLEAIRATWKRNPDAEVSVTVIPHDGHCGGDTVAWAIKKNDPAMIRLSDKARVIADHFSDLITDSSSVDDMEAKSVQFQVAVMKEILEDELGKDAARVKVSGELFHAEVAQSTKHPAKHFLVYSTPEDMEGKTFEGVCKEISDRLRMHVDPNETYFVMAEHLQEVEGDMDIAVKVKALDIKEFILYHSVKTEGVVKTWTADKFAIALKEEGVNMQQHRSGGVDAQRSRSAF